MPSSTSPNMVLFLPVPGSTAGPQWASETTSNWSTVDTHDHTAGKGVQIPIAALNVNADFSWLTFGQTNIGYAAFTDKLATGNLTVNQSLGNVAGDPYWRNASGVVKKLSLAGDPITLPSGTVASGSLLFTAIAAPGTPAAGKVIAWVDSTTRNWSTKDEFGNVSVSAFPTVGVASQWFRSMNASGVFTSTQPAFTDISGSLAIGQIPNSLVTYAKIQNVSATARVLGRKTAGAGVIEELTAADVASVMGGSLKILDQTFSGVASVTISFTANQYKRITVFLYQSTGTFSNVTLTGLSAASYSMQYVFNVGAGAPTTASTSGANNWNAGNTSPLDGFIDIFLPPAPAQKGAKIDLAATGGIGQFASGRSSDVTNDPTAVVINMSAASAGYITAWGYP